MSGKMRWAGMFFFAAAMVLVLNGPARALDVGPSEVDMEKIAVKFHKDVSKGGYALITTDELKAMLEKKEPVLVVDTMPLEASYNKQHVKGAVQFEFPTEEQTEMTQAQKAEFEKLLGPDKNRKIVFYCGFTKCARSHNGAMWAKKLGYTDVLRYPGGIKAWVEAGNPVDSAQ